MFSIKSSIEAYYTEDNDIHLSQGFTEFFLGFSNYLSLDTPNHPRISIY